MNMNMKMNVGPNEKYMRIGMGIFAAAIIPFVRSGWAKSLLGMAATSGIATGVTRYCPINQALGLGEGMSEGKYLSGQESRDSRFSQRDNMGMGQKTNQPGWSDSQGLTH